MLFNSYIFIFVFLPISFFVYFYLNKKRLTQASKAFLVFSSLFFYSWWNIVYLTLILFSMLFNFSIGSSFKKNKNQKYLLIFAILANILLLGYFKYSDFFIKNINFVFDSSIDLLNLALPLAISFFTFQQIAYLVDSYKGETKEYDFLNYAIFVSFFPQLIAGPIVHHKEMMPQFSSKKAKIINFQNVALGIFIFCIGLFKKVVIADTFAIWANNGFDIVNSLNFVAAWATSLSYTFQLYFDFSGYTDMAIGAALFFNIKLPINFNSPYKSLDIQDFWRRWHITLSRFLRDYIYIPLGGNKKGNYKTYSNLMVTFLIGGLWHGAGWTFIFWGFLHGCALIIHRIWHNLGFKLNKILAWFITFNFINITWIFFRAKEWEDAVKVLKGMFAFTTIVLPEKYIDSLNFLNQYFTFGEVLKDINGENKTITYLILAMILVLCFKNSMQLRDNFKTNIFYLTLTICIFVISIGELSGFSEFLYFNF